MKNGVFWDVTPCGSCKKVLSRATRRNIPEDAILHSHRREILKSYKVLQLFIDFKKAHDSVRWEVLYNILIEFGIPLKIIRLIEMCLNDTYSEVRIGKPLYDSFPIQRNI
jgi:hypothetical protein